MKKTKLRKFDDSYIKYDVMEYRDGRTQYTLCLKILSIEALKLNQHFFYVSCRKTDCWKNKPIAVQIANQTWATVIYSIKM